MTDLNTHEPVRVILLEDSAPDAAHILRILQGANEPGYVVEHFDRIGPMILRLRSGQWDVALIDLCVPDSKGLPTLRRVREAAPHLPVVVQSGLDEESLAIEAVREGAQDYIVKEDVEARLLVRALRYAIERKRIEQQLRESDERFNLAVQGANDGLWDWDLRTNRVWFSARWRSMTGFGTTEHVSVPEGWFDLVPQEHAGALAAALRAHLDGLTPHLEHEYPIRHADGTLRWMLCRGLAVRDRLGNAYRVAGSQTDITQRKHIEEQLLHDAFHDALTGLPNRALFHDRLRQAMRRAERGSPPFAVLFLDLDRFKLVNDSLGHLVGDRLLVDISRRLRTCLRPGDTVARFGGDEFAMLLEDVRSPADVDTAAERIQEVGSSRVDLQACKLEYSIVSPK